MLTNDNNRIGNNIRSLREAYGETQQQLADAINTTRTNIINYEKHGYGNPEIISAIAKRYMVSVYELLYCDFSGLKKINYDKNVFWKNLEIFFPIISSEKALKNSDFNTAYILHKKIYSKFKDSDVTNIWEECMDDFSECFDKYLDVITSDSNENLSYDDYVIEASLNFLAINYLMLTIFVSTKIAMVDKTSIVDKAVVQNKQLQEMINKPETVDELTQILKGLREDIDPEIIYSIKEDAVKSQMWSELAYYYLAMEYVLKIVDNDMEHATEIVEAVKDVFKGEFPNGQIPEHFVQKITYSSDDSNALIRDLRNEKDFRIAVTVTLVATGTDVKPLEIVLFMKDVFSDVLYTQMRGRGCRVISDDKLKEVTPNADTKDCYYIVDAVGVTEHEKYIPRTGPTVGGRISLEHLLERLAHNELSDENLYLLRDYCATIHRRYENNLLFGRHLDSFIADFNYSPRDLAMSIQAAFDNGQLPPFVSSSDDNAVRMALVDRLIS
ncbi:DNA-binding helix-turn-helix protein, partial [Ruminococcus albus 8]